MSILASIDNYAHDALDNYALQGLFVSAGMSASPKPQPLGSRHLGVLPSARTRSSRRMYLHLVPSVTAIAVFGTMSATVESKDSTGHRVEALVAPVLVSYWRRRYELPPERFWPKIHVPPALDTKRAPSA